MTETFSGAETAGSLARKYRSQGNTVHGCVGHSLLPRTTKAIGLQQSAAISERWSPVRKEACACPEVTLLRRAPLLRTGGPATAFSEASGGSRVLEPFHVRGSPGFFKWCSTRDRVGNCVTGSPAGAGCGCGDNERSTGQDGRSAPQSQIRPLRGEAAKSPKRGWGRSEATPTLRELLGGGGAVDRCWRKKVRRSVGAVRGFQPARQYCCVGRFQTQRLSFPQVVGDGPF